jgi:hypothetical protein
MAVILHKNQSQAFYTLFPLFLFSLFLYSVHTLDAVDIGISKYGSFEKLEQLFRYLLYRSHNEYEYGARLGQVNFEVETTTRRLLVKYCRHLKTCTKNLIRLSKMKHFVHRKVLLHVQILAAALFQQKSFIQENMAKQSTFL